MVLLNLQAEAEKKKKKKFKPYTGKIRPVGNKLTESLEQTEMSMLAAEISASMPRQSGIIGPVVTMPASCHSILKVSKPRYICLNALQVDTLDLYYIESLVCYCLWQ